mgnify:CR=1 FL=1
MKIVSQKTIQSDSIEDALKTLTKGKRQAFLTSVTKLEDSSYPGHIVTIVGVIGTGLNSNTKLIAFNSAIKSDSGSVNYCSTDNQPGDSQYKAGVITTNNFTLKTFDGLGFAILKLKKNK